MKVKLTYFRPGGKYYSSGEYETRNGHLFNIWDEVKEMRDKNELPDILTNDWIILVEVPEHINDHPKLILPRFLLEAVKSHDLLNEP